MAVEAKHTRLGEYEQRILDLRHLSPRDQVRLSQMENWARVLKEQNDRLRALDTERKKSELKKQIPVDREGAA
ncbi:TPA: hypothetical protein DCE37_18180 [Candidatus Latescibacteria bacterium]|nr:hypothetical protein [Candidatus Latescibacterota bacterium]|tara:strand:- start:322 stop:540 length:219 start_codon:yes stop_codon:yes gene_type:complete